MTDRAEYIAQLLVRSFNGDLSEKEAAELEHWKRMRSHKNEFKNFTDHEWLADQLQQFNAIDSRRIGQKLANKTQVIAVSELLDDEEVEIPVITKAHRVSFLQTAWFRVAAAILIIMGIGAYLWLKPLDKKPEITQTQPVPVKNDILPGGNKAILKLADGSEIILDDASKGILAEESGSTIKKTADGNIEYLSKNNSGSAVAYNTMSTPRGGQYQLMLPDGSKVWLNAESSITFPTAFTTTKREVKITGEVYFEIIKNKEKPFIITTGKDEITVLGTAFNIMAYPDETNSKTSLIEGSVKVNNIILKPGQAYINNKIIATDIAQDIAWKNGFFNFQHSSLEQAMRQLARWYDVDIKYKGEQRNVEFGGEIGRSLSLQRVIKGLEGMEGLHFELKEKTLTVSF